MCAKMRSSNLCPTSLASESEFKNIKRLLAIKTRRLDIFVDKHLDHLSGLLKLGLAQQKFLDKKEDWGQHRIYYYQKQKLRVSNR